MAITLPPARNLKSNLKLQSINTNRQENTMTSINAPPRIAADTPQMIPLGPHHAIERNTKDRPLTAQEEMNAPARATGETPALAQGQSVTAAEDPRTGRDTHRVRSLAKSAGGTRRTRSPRRAGGPLRRMRKGRSRLDSLRLGSYCHLLTAGLIWGKMMKLI